MKKAEFVTVKVKSLKVKIMYFNKSNNQVGTIETTVDCSEKSLDKYCKTLIPDNTVYLQTEIVEKVEGRIGISADLFNLLAIKVVELNGNDVYDLSSDEAKFKNTVHNSLKNDVAKKLERVREIGFEAYTQERQQQRINNQ